MTERQGRGSKARRSVSRTDRDERIPLSSKKHFLNLFWALFPAGVCLVIAFGGAIACLVIVLNGLGVKELIAVAVLVLVIGLCLVFVVAFLPSIRLFLFSVRPGGYYLLTDTLLQRYTGDDRLVEQIPYTNMARVRLATARSGVDQESRYRILNMELKEDGDNHTILDPHFLAWSRKSQGHDIAMIESFFDEPLKSVYQRIKKRWQMSNKNSATADPDDDAGLL
jgi:hypothetical protein